MLSQYLAVAHDNERSTNRTCRYVVNAWKKRTANPPADRIDADAFNQFRRVCLEEKLSPHTIEGWIGYMLTMLSVAGLHPDEGRRLKRDEPDPTMPTLEEFGKVWLAAEHATKPKCGGVSAPDYMRGLLVFGLWTGMRLDDWFRVTSNDVDDSVIRRRAKKTGKFHEYPNCEMVRRHLAKVTARDGALFPFWRTCQTRLRDALKELCEAAGVPYFTPQEIRRLSVNTWTDASPFAGAIIQGTAIGNRSAMPWYLARQKPRRILELAAPSFVWPDVMLTSDDRERRRSGTEELLRVIARLPAQRVTDVHRVALAFVGD